MRKLLKALSAVLVGAGLLSLPAIAQAQELTLRLEPGVAIPVGSPQDNRFFVGGALAIKPELTLDHYVGVGPSIAVETFPSTISGVDGPTAWGFGGFVRIKRPHDSLNTGTGFSAVSPWVDADLQYIRTGSLDRFGFAVAAGAQVPTSASRWLWVGPFVRLEDVNQDGGQPGLDTRNSKTLIAGLSFEFGAKAAPKTATPPPPTTPPVVVVERDPEPVPPPPPPPPPVRREVAAVVQFAWDSAVLDSVAVAVLNEALHKIGDVSTLQSIEVEGFASSEGQLAHNQKLAQSRANSVRDYLVARGVTKTKVGSLGMGIRRPVATNATEVGRVRNRRAECKVKFIVVKEGK